MKYCLQVIRNWFYIPSFFEISILYLLLGFYIAVATDILVPYIYFNAVFYSLIMVECFYLLRVISLSVVLQTKKIQGYCSRWFQLIFLCIMMILIFMTNLDITLKLWLSESVLSKEVQHIQSLPKEYQANRLDMDPQPAGFFNIQLDKIDKSNKTIWFHTVDGIALFKSRGLYGGLVYSENGFPPDIPERTYEHLYGPWWSWVQDI